LSWIVRVALQRPYTFIVMALLIAIFGVAAAITTPKDIFPDIRVPVVGAVFSYAGLPASDMNGRIVSGYERFITTTVNDIQHIESQSLNGYGIVKIFFQPGTDIRTASTQVAATSQATVRNFPPGAQPPLLLNYSASTVPILQIAESSPTLSEQALLDLSQTVLRPALVTVPGLATPNPLGGKQRQLQIDLDPQAMTAHQISAQDVQSAIAAQIQVLPAGTVKIGALQYNVTLNNAAETVEQMNDLPVRIGAGPTVYMRDIGHVRDGAPPQTNIVHVNGGRAVMALILKNGAASTLDIVQGVKDKLPKIKEQLPDDMKFTLFNDQSIFVRGAISGVVREGVIAAALTSLMILLFLGSWRSTVIIAISIPLAVLAAIAGLQALGETLNLMTLGGLALAVGILVDDTTVTVENINWHLEQGKDVRTAILDGANQIVAPAFVSLLCICIVFVPMFALKGVAGFLFVPLAKAVVLAMVASFVLSRTLTPTLAMYLLKPHSAEQLDFEHAAEKGAAAPPSRNPLVRLQRAFEARFSAVRTGYRDLLVLMMGRRRGFVFGFLAVVALSFGLAPFLGKDFFPSVDSGQIALHFRGPPGLRVEETSLLAGQIEGRIRQVVPPGELGSMIDSVGLVTSPINLLFSNSGVVGSQDGDIYVTLKPGHGPTAAHVKRLRESLPRAFPGVTFSFLPADMVSQILNFGLPAPIDLQVAGPRAEANRTYVTMLMRRVREIPGAADVRIQQPAGTPDLHINVDRSRIGQIGLTERDVTSSVLTSLSGSGQVAPNFWLNPKNGVNYGIVAQTPEYQLGSLSDLENLPITGAGSTAGAQVLGGLARIVRQSSPPLMSLYDTQPVFDIYATPQGRDLGAISTDIRRIIKQTAGQVPKGSTVTLRGQSATMDVAFSGLGYGILAAIVLVYLMIVVNFQSWLDPFVIITALPAALAGIVWILFATGTTLSVPALTGALMCMGVATANSILVVSFARERLAATGDAVAAAVEAGFTRFRPVLMTALAMIIGMSPMALGLGEGGEQNAPLGLAVIGGLIFATLATLTFVPVVFSLVHGRRSTVPVPGPEAREVHV
jgi:multidrug efflux pump subunit AcrB